MYFKKNIKQVIIIISLSLVWIAYFIQTFKLYSQVKDFITPGSSYVIRLLEFTNYRGNELSIVLIEFFILFSLTSLLYIYIYRTMKYVNQKKLLNYIIVINILYILVVSVISNIFWVVYVLMAILSLLIVTASIYVSNIFFDSTVEFQKGDIIFYSEPYDTEGNAQVALNKKITQLDKNKISILSGDTFKIDKEFFFEIYANDQLILDNKGEFIVNEKTKK